MVQVVMPSRTLAGLIAAGVILLALLGKAPVAAAGAADRSALHLAPGLRVTFASSSPGTGQTTDNVVLPNVALYVPSGQTPSPFVPPGPFTAEWNGFISVDLRGEYAFQAEVQGFFTLQLNGALALEIDGSATNKPSGLIRLRKGPNVLFASFRSPPQGDAFVRLSWVPKDGLPSPIPLANLSHDPSGAELPAATRRQRGRALFVEYRCHKCHTADQAGGNPELAIDAPSFGGIGSRLGTQWLQEWIANPAQQRSNARMPRLFHTGVEEQAKAVAAYLATLEDVSSPAQVGCGSGSPSAGKELFESLHCAACHEPPEAPPSDAARVWLGHAARKFKPGMLAGFLRQPQRHFAWTGMPDFQLTADEAADLAAYLQGEVRLADSPGHTAFATRGRELVQNSGCLNCHAHDLENSFAAKPLAALPRGPWQSGCLSTSPDPDSRAPFFALTPQEREDLQAFAATDRSALARHSPAEFAPRQMQRLRCAECHGKFDGFPSLDSLAGKLRPEWSSAFIAGQLPYRPRPWLRARMPAFSQDAAVLAQGFALLHGYSPVTPPEPPCDSKAAEIGQKLVSANGGLSCISCHSVGEVQATQVFENAGINLAYTRDRLLKPYYERWLRNPMALDPVSKMPVFFDEQLRSVLLDVLDGDGSRQIEAIWQYLCLGNEMPPPTGVPPK